MIFAIEPRPRLGGALPERRGDLARPLALIRCQGLIGSKCARRGKRPWIPEKGRRFDRELAAARRGSGGRGRAAGMLQVPVAVMHPVVVGDAAIRLHAVQEILFGGQRIRLRVWRERRAMHVEAVVGDWTMGRTRFRATAP